MGKSSAIVPVTPPIRSIPPRQRQILAQNCAALSSGQRQRVALALYDDPALIVLDELNSNFDEAGDAALMKALQGLKQEIRSVFAVTNRANV